MSNRIHHIKIYNENQELSILNCYFPNRVKDRTKLIELMIRKYKFPNTNNIILGDFNFIESKLDTKNQHLFTITKDKKTFKLFKNENGIIDIFRKKNKTQKIYTFKNKKGATRIDRIYISSSLIPFIEGIKHIPTIKTDHIFMPTIELKYTTKTRWGKGSYKLNNSILNSIYVKEEFHNTWQIHKEAKLYANNLNEWWETGKKMIKECFKKASIEVNSANKKITEKIKNDLSTLLKENNRKNKDIIASLKRKLEKIYEIKYEGSRIRTRIKKLENEIPDKSFFEKEKNLGKLNTLNKVRSKTDQIILEPTKILNEVKNYYDELWGKSTEENEKEIKTYLEVVEKSSDDQNEITLGNNWITEKEVANAINQLKNDTAPGSDGLTSEFYKTFQKLLIPDLTEVFNNILLIGELPETMLEATIKLIYKKDDHKTIKNWRPISLLNTDYKILSKIIVNRLVPIMQNHILPQQNAGLPKRRIENVHYNMQALMEMAEQKKDDLIIMTIDFEKAFDSISHHFIFETLEKLKIGDINLSFIKIFYNNIFSKIEINGAFTSKINIKRGIRQGCPLSMLLFITCTDVLTRHVIKNNQIKGITFQKINLKITQYADDTTFSCQNIHEIYAIMNELEKFEKVSGLKINQDKTQILITNRKIQEKIRLDFPMIHIKDSLKILGIKFYLEPIKNKKNWKETIPKIIGTLQKHEKRNLSIFGRIQIIKTLIVPLFIHVARIFQPTDKCINKISQILFKFIWGNHPIEQLSRNKLISEIEEGGVKMIDIKSKTDTCYVEKIKYLANLNQTNELWQQWACYNLFYKIRHINNKLYDRTKAHNLIGNNNWNYTFSIFMKLKKLNLDWINIAHKTIYLYLKDQRSKKTHITSTNNKEKIPWKTIILKSKKIKKFFNNNEHELNYRIATNAFKWHVLNKKTTKQSCKFCHQPSETIEHILINCNPILKIWERFEKFLSKNNIAKIKLNKDMILYNYFDKVQNNLIVIIKLMNLIKNKIIEKKKELDKKQQYIWSNKEFQRYVLEVINIKYKEIDLD